MVDSASGVEHPQDVTRAAKGHRWPLLLALLAAALAIAVGAPERASAAADLQLTVTDTPDPAVPGDILTIRGTVKNNGDETAYDVRVTFSTITNATVASARAARRSATSPSPIAESVTWRRRSRAPQPSRSTCPTTSRSMTCRSTRAPRVWTSTRSNSSIRRLTTTRRKRQHRRAAGRPQARAVGDHAGDDREHVDGHRNGDEQPARPGARDQAAAHRASRAARRIGPGGLRGDRPEGHLRPGHDPEPRNRDALRSRSRCRTRARSSCSAASPGRGLTRRPSTPRCS